MKNILYKIFPFLNWIGEAKKNWKDDLIAGITVSLVLIPHAMALAQLAEMPVQYGLYAGMLPVVVAGLWGSSRFVTTGPVALTSLLTASVIGGMYAPFSADYIFAAAYCSFIIAFILLLMAALRLGVLLNFISHPVNTGFISAAGVIIALSQISNLTKLARHRENSIFRNLIDLFHNIGHIHIPTLIMGLSGIVMILLLKKKSPKFPAILVTAIFATIVSKVIGYEQIGGAILGEIPSGLPVISLPKFDFDLFMKLLPGAAVITVVGLIEAVSIAKNLAAKEGQKIELNQELIGQGLANFSSGLSSGYPVTESFARSAVNYDAGAKSGLAGVFCGVFVAIFVMFCTGAIYYLPKAILASIIISAVIKLIKFDGITEAWKVNKFDGGVAGLTFLLTILLAPHIHQGIFAGIALSFIFRFIKVSTRHLEDNTFADTAKVGDISVRKHLNFLNGYKFEKEVEKFVEQNKEKSYITADCRKLVAVDATGVQIIREIHSRLSAMKIDFKLINLNEKISTILKNVELQKVL